MGSDSNEITYYALSHTLRNKLQVKDKMARLPRFVIPGQPQHIIQRGNNRGIIFVADEDYRFYLQKLSDACKKYDCE